MTSLNLSLDLGQISPIIFTLVDFPMTFLTNRHLLAVDGCHIEAEALQILTAFADMFDVVHFDPVRAIADGTVIQ